MELHEEHYRMLQQHRASGTVRDLVDEQLFEQAAPLGLAITDAGREKLEEASRCHKPGRIRQAWTFLVLGLVLLPLIIVFLHEWVFYRDAYGDWRDLGRIVWLVPFVFFGLALRGYRFREYPTAAGWVYVFEYLPDLVVGATLLFAVLHTFEETTSGWLYYPFSAPVIFVHSQAPGRMREWILGRVPGSPVS